MRERELEKRCWLSAFDFVHSPPLRPGRDLREQLSAHWAHLREIFSNAEEKQATTTIKFSREFPERKEESFGFLKIGKEER